MEELIPQLHSKAGCLKNREEPIFQFKSEGKKKVDVPLWKQSSRRDSPLLRGRSAFLFSPSADWMMPTHIRRAMCLTQSTDDNLSQKHPYRHIQKNVWQIPNIWVPSGSMKLTHKITITVSSPGKIEFSGIVKLESQEYPGSYEWTQYNHQGSCKETKPSKRRDVTIKAEFGVMCFEGKGRDHEQRKADGLETDSHVVPTEGNGRNDPTDIQHCKKVNLYCFKPQNLL